MAPLPLIAVAYASIGSGHRIAAEAIAAEVADVAGDGAAVQAVDVLDHARVKVSGNALTGAFTGPTAGIYDAVWGSVTLGALSRTLSSPALAWNYRSFSEWLEETRPAVLVCTHALPAVLAARLVNAGRIRTHIVCSATDFGVHGFWPVRGVSLFCCADASSADELRRRGYSEVADTGIAVRSQFTLEYDTAAARRHFDLPEDKRVVLALAGSTMPGPYERFKEALSVSLPALGSLPDTEFAVVCGNDEQYATELRTRAKGFGLTSVSVFGYVEHMAPLMAAADLVLAKPGGAVSAECLAVGVPLVLVGPAAGQENANASALAKAGAALFAADPRTIAEYARKAVSRPARLNAMRTAATALARPFAANDIATKVLALAGAASDSAPEPVSDNGA